MTPPRDTPGPADPTGGDFVLIEATSAEAEDDAEPLQLADGSDVVDVEGLGRQLDADALDSMLRDYLEDDDELPVPPPHPAKG